MPSVTRNSGPPRHPTLHGTYLEIQAKVNAGVKKTLQNETDNLVSPRERERERYQEGDKKAGTSMHGTSWNYFAFAAMELEMTTEVGAWKSAEDSSFCGFFFFFLSLSLSLFLAIGFGGIASTHWHLSWGL